MEVKEFVLKKKRFIFNLDNFEEKIGDTLFKPKFEDVIFSEKQGEFMKLILEHIKGERKNLLFCGKAGTGKTYSSKMIACETGKPFVYLNGVMSKKKIVHLLLSAKENAIILIDEIHNLPDSLAEVIYPAIEDNEISHEGKTHILPNLTFLGTTTEPENLPKPLLDRFMRIEFDEPDEETIKKILIKMGLEEESANLMINYTLNIRLLKKFIEYIKLYGELNKENLIKVFRLMKINIFNGLSDEQEKYIDYLKKIKKASLRNLGLVLRRSENYIKMDIEPDLIRKQIIQITSKGRELSPDFIKNEDLLKEENKYHTDKTIDEIGLARQFLNEHPNIKEKFSGRYFELTQFIADKIVEGITPDLIDWTSFGNDKEIKDSYKDNYIEDL